jgi:hypothetical protein
MEIINDEKKHKDRGDYDAKKGKFVGSVHRGTSYVTPPEVSIRKYPANGTAGAKKNPDRCETCLGGRY